MRDERGEGQGRSTGKPIGDTGPPLRKWGGGIQQADEERREKDKREASPVKLVNSSAPLVLTPEEIALILAERQRVTAFFSLFARVFWGLTKPLVCMLCGF